MKTRDFSGIRCNGRLPEPENLTVAADVRDLLGDYFDSTISLLEELERVTLEYESGAARNENAAAIKRILHKLKGEAGIIGLDDVHELCHEAESAFEELGENRRPDMLLRLKDWVYAAVQTLM